jgi:hypothetical protein
MGAEHQHHNKGGVIKGIKSFFQSLTKEVVINYLADLLDIGFKWVIGHWKTIFIPIVILLWGAIIEFARITYAVSGLQIIIVICIVLLILIAAFNAYKIRKWLIKRKDKYFEYYGFYWKMDEKNMLIGPYCIGCGKQIIQIHESFEIEMDRTIGEMFGEKPNYTYQCNKCDTKIMLGVPLAKLKATVMQEINMHNE